MLEWNPIPSLLDIDLDARVETVGSTWRAKMFASHLTDLIRKPDPGSEFEIRTQTMRDALPEDRWVPELLKAGYGGMLLLDNKDQVHGQLFYEARIVTISVFSFIIYDESERGIGLGLDAIIRLIGFAQRWRFQRIVLGSPNSCGTPWDWNRWLTGQKPLIEQMTTQYGVPVEVLASEQTLSLHTLCG